MPASKDKMCSLVFQYFLLQDINSPTDSVIGRDFQELSAEEQERQREEWKQDSDATNNIWLFKY